MRRNILAQYDRIQENQLKSLQCSSVHEAPLTTNQSYEMSWLEKLVGDWDQNEKKESHHSHHLKYSRNKEYLPSQMNKKEQYNIEKKYPNFTKKSLASYPEKNALEKKQDIKKKYDYSRYMEVLSQKSNTVNLSTDKSIKEVKFNNNTNNRIKFPQAYQENQKMKRMSEKLDNFLSSINQKRNIKPQYEEIYEKKLQIDNRVEKKISLLDRQDLHNLAGIKQMNKRPSYRQFQHKNTVKPFQIKFFDTKIGEKNQNDKLIHQKKTFYQTNKQNTTQDKYEEMKKSLRYTRHAPKEIIIEESSSSEWASEVSPRLNFFNKQFNIVFELLDSDKSGTLSQKNCSIQNIPEQLKYLFGGILSKIKYKNQQFTIQKFIRQCHHSFKEFVVEELSEIFSSFKLQHKNIKYGDKLRLTGKKTLDCLQQCKHVLNETNQNDTKRSNDHSQVMKRYEFQIERENDFEKDKNYQFATKIISKSPYLNQQYSPFLQRKNLKQHLQQKIEQERKNTDNISQLPQFSLEQNISQPSSNKFEKMCDSLNSKLNSYIASIYQVQKIPSIKLQFSQLAKHWRSKQ